jgi:hypothetical protein
VATPPAIIAGALGAGVSALAASILPIYSMFGPDTGIAMKRANDRKRLMIGPEPDRTQGF